MADEEEVKEKKSGGKGLVIVLLVVVILLLVGIGVMAFLLLSGDKSAEEGTETAEVHGSAEHGEEVPASELSHGKEYSPKYKQFEPPAPETPPQYFTMDKFVVNFYGDGQAKFLAVDLKFLSYYSQVVGDAGEMENLRPILKNDIERLLRNQHYNDLVKPEGPDQLREQILEVTRKVLEKHNIYPDLVEDVYMTRFVMQ